MAEVTIEFEGKTYTRQKYYWVDAQHQQAPAQGELDRKYYKQFLDETHSVQEYIDLAGEFRQNGSLGYAAKCFQYVLEHGTIEECRIYYPCLTSLYREMNQPQKAVDLEPIMEQRGALTHVALTSIAAAYCDLGNLNEAKKCANRAMAMNHGTADQELIAVFARIKKDK